MPENKEMQCKMYSKNFSEIELRESWIARNNKIVNLPPEYAKKNLRKLCKNILQPIRDKWGDVICVNSGYRCKELNQKIGGVHNSQHLTGDAADICPKNRKDVQKLFDFIKEMIANGEINVGQLILERAQEAIWVHVSNPRTDKDNNQIFVMNKNKDKQSKLQPT